MDMTQNSTLNKWLFIFHILGIACRNKNMACVCKYYNEMYLCIRATVYTDILLIVKCV